MSLGRGREKSESKLRDDLENVKAQKNARKAQLEAEGKSYSEIYNDNKFNNLENRAQELAAEITLLSMNRGGGR